MEVQSWRNFGFSTRFKCALGLHIVLILRSHILNLTLAPLLMVLILLFPKRLIFINIRITGLILIIILQLRWRIVQKNIFFCLYLIIIISLICHWSSYFNIIWIGVYRIIHRPSSIQLRIWNFIYLHILILRRIAHRMIEMHLLNKVTFILSRLSMIRICLWLIFVFCGLMIDHVISF